MENLGERTWERQSNQFLKCTGDVVLQNMEVWILLSQGVENNILFNMDVWEMVQSVVERNIVELILRS